MKLRLWPLSLMLIVFAIMGVAVLTAGIWGLLALFIVGLSYQFYWRYRHGRWQTYDDVMDGDA